jgi:hypothetical protein
MRHLPEYEPDGDRPKIVPSGFKCSEKDSPSSTPLNVLPISVSLIWFPDSDCPNAVVEKARIVLATTSAIRMMLSFFRSWYFAIRSQTAWSIMNACQRPPNGRSRQSFRQSLLMCHIAQTKGGFASITRL